MRWCASYRVHPRNWAAASPLARRSTIAPVFVDTNVFVYARDSSDPAKQARASEWLRHLWESRTGRISFQVLEEYYVTVTRKLAPGLDRRQARADIEDLMVWRPVPIGEEVLSGAFSIEDRFSLSFWDSLVVSAAQVARCDMLLTEDLQTGGQIDGVMIVDPFSTAVGGGI